MPPRQDRYDRRRRLQGGNSGSRVPLMPTALRPRKVAAETRALRCVLAAAGCVIVASAVLDNPVSMLLSLAVCLACGSRMEHNYRRGAYGCVELEGGD
jgi:hypothetical protein